MSGGKRAIKALAPKAEEIEPKPRARLSLLGLQLRPCQQVGLLGSAEPRRRRKALVAEIKRREPQVPCRHIATELEIAHRGPGRCSSAASDAIGNVERQLAAKRQIEEAANAAARAKAWPCLPEERLAM